MEKQKQMLSRLHSPRGGFILQSVVSLDSALPPDPRVLVARENQQRGWLGRMSLAERGDIKKTEVLENSIDFYQVEPKNGYKNASSVRLLL